MLNQMPPLQIYKNLPHHPQVPAPAPYFDLDDDDYPPDIEENSSHVNLISNSSKY